MSVSDKERIYARLADAMPDYSDYMDVPVAPNGELLVPIAESGVLIVGQIREDARPITGDKTYVREGVAARLRLASIALAATAPGLQLDVGYGYRAASVQMQRFLGQLQRLGGSYENRELWAEAHRSVAVPEVAGHPAGAAVDIQISKHGQPLNFGTNMWEFVPDSYSFSPFVPAEARENRRLLRTIMVGAGFAPFDGEWWHFSFGDKEWAKYYGQPAAIYEQVEFSAPD